MAKSDVSDQAVRASVGFTPCRHGEGRPLTACMDVSGVITLMDIVTDSSPRRRTEEAGAVSEQKPDFCPPSLHPSVCVHPLNLSVTSFFLSFAALI